MPHTFTNLLVHVIFSTKDRAPVITPEIRDDLYAYIGGIIRELDGTAMAIGGIADHVHLLLRLPPELDVSRCLRVVKTNSSRWVHRRWPVHRAFAWQIGYGAFTVSASNEAAVAKYIRRQEEHHRKVFFREEFIAFLRKQGVPFEERYLWK